MRTLRKRKIAKANSLKYYKAYKCNYTNKNVYYLDHVQGYGSIGDEVEYSYEENFIKSLKLLKSLNIKDGVVLD